MQIQEYFKLILKSLNPNKYKEMAKIPFFNLVKYFFFIILLSLLVSVIILVPMITQYKDNLSSELEGVEQFQINVESSINEPITVLKKPKIVVDFQKENMTNEWILVNENSVSYNKYFFFGKEKAFFGDYQSVQEDESVSLYSKVVIFLLPSVLFWILFIFLIKYAVLISIFSLLGWMFFMSGRNKMTFRNSLKAAIFTATPMIIIDLALWPIAVMYLVPILIYIFFFAMGLMMVAERKGKKHHHKGKKKDEGHFEF